ncbi:IclR family transcriptional regulator [Novosphingobium rosa]|uniref:IclR family transcriptional regulator n=1 Tax=Novosphingobium rosa TaxID=76978 RepID=UPI000835F23C|nr:IclR family transcriptional regulator [Novosphingobium rosa]
MTEDRSGVKSLNLALDVIEAVASAEEDIGVTELAVRLGLTKATVFRHLQTLVERNYLAQNARTSRYRLGIQCQLLAQLSSNRIDLRSASEEVAQWLREETGLSVVVSAVRARSVIVLSTLMAKSALQIGVRPGSELSLHSSAQGRAALAFGAPSLMTYARRQKVEQNTPYTIMDWNELDAKIAQVRLTGWADAPEELALGLNAVAAPVYDESGDCVGTIAVVGLIQNLPRAVDPDVAEALLAAAQRVSANLGHVKTEKATAINA